MINNTEISFRNYTLADQVLLAAHVLTAASAFCFTLATLLKLIEGGTLPDGPLGGAANANRNSGSLSAKDYFT